MVFYPKHVLESAVIYVTLYLVNGNYCSFIKRMLSSRRVQMKVSLDTVLANNSNDKCSLPFMY